MVSKKTFPLLVNWANKFYAVDLIVSNFDEIVKDTCKDPLNTPIILNFSSSLTYFSTDETEKCEASFSCGSSTELVSLKGADGSNISFIAPPALPHNTSHATGFAVERFRIDTEGGKAGADHFQLINSSVDNAWSTMTNSFISLVGSTRRLINTKEGDTGNETFRMKNITLKMDLSCGQSIAIGRTLKIPAFQNSLNLLAHNLAVTKKKRDWPNVYVQSLTDLKAMLGNSKHSSDRHNAPLPSSYLFNFLPASGGQPKVLQLKGKAFEGFHGNIGESDPIDHAGDSDHIEADSSSQESPARARSPFFVLFHSYRESVSDGTHTGLFWTDTKFDEIDQSLSSSAVLLTSTRIDMKESFYRVYLPEQFEEDHVDMVLAGGRPKQGISKNAFLPHSLSWTPSLVSCGSEYSVPMESTHAVPGVLLGSVSCVSIYRDIEGAMSELQKFVESSPMFHS